MVELSKYTQAPQKVIKTILVVLLIISCISSKSKAADDDFIIPTNGYLEGQD